MNQVDEKWSSESEAHKERLHHSTWARSHKSAVKVCAGNEEEEEVLTNIKNCFSASSQSQSLFLISSVSLSERFLLHKLTPPLGPLLCEMSAV